MLRSVLRTAFVGRIRCTRTTIQGAYHGTAIMPLVRNYCPNIPIPENKAWFQNELHHLFTEWVEGKSLHSERVTEVGTNHLNGTSLLKIPTTVATSLADFVYNLTTCPIPMNMSNGPRRGLFDDVQCGKPKWSSVLRYAASTN